MSSSQRLKVLDVKNPSIRTLHFTWIAFFITFVVWFNHAPMVMAIREAFDLSKGQWKALLILNVGKREFAAQVEPLFRRHDGRSYLVAAVALRIHGIITFAETGYTTVYHRIPKTPDELQEQREEDTWAMAEGFASKIDVLRTRNPGMDQAAAIQHLAQVAVEDALVAQRTQELLAEAGLADTTPEPEEDNPGEGGEDVMAMLRRMRAQLEQT